MCRAFILRLMWELSSRESLAPDVRLRFYEIAIPDGFTRSEAPAGLLCSLFEPSSSSEPRKEQSFPGKGRVVAAAGPKVTAGSTMSGVGRAARGGINSTAWLFVPPVGLIRTAAVGSQGGGMNFKPTPCCGGFGSQI